MNTTNRLAVMVLLVFCTLQVFSQDIKVVAHRGYWKVEGSAQNSIHSLRGAQALNCYGSEFDVWITSDTVAVVTHDSKVNGMVIEETPYVQVKSIQLPNGEMVPTLDDYLKAGKKGSTQLILEVKSRFIPELEVAVAHEVVERVKKAKVRSKTEYITGSTRVIKEIAVLDPEAKIAYVASMKTAIEPRKLNELGCNGIDYHYSVYQKYPHWVKEAHGLGMKVNVWTVNTEELMVEMIDAGVDYITTDEPVLLQKVLNKYKM